jgi:hypothetical protein
MPYKAPHAIKQAFYNVLSVCYQLPLASQGKKETVLIQ